MLRTLHTPRCPRFPTARSQRERPVFLPLRTSPQVRLDLDLPSQLVLDARSKKLLLLENLERHDVLRPFLPREVHRAELAPPQR